MVPDAEFTSYYGRPIVKPSPWREDIPAYLFLGGLAGGSALLGAGADVTGRPALRRNARLSALGRSDSASPHWCTTWAGRRAFSNMLRVAKPTSPMSVGTWILTGFGPAVGVAAAAEFADRAPRPLRGTLRFAGRPAGLAAALLGPAVAAYTAVLISDTATPTWHEGHRELPFLFVGSAALASGGMGMLTVPVPQAGPARRLAVGGVLLELAAERRMESSLGIAAETAARRDAGPAHARQQGAGRRRPGRHGLRRSGSASRRGRRRGAARQFGLHPVRHLLCRAALGPGPEVHRGAAACPARRRQVAGLGSW